VETPDQQLTKPNDSTTRFSWERVSVCEIVTRGWVWP